MRAVVVTSHRSDGVAVLSHASSSDRYFFKYHLIALTGDGINNPAGGVAFQEGSIEPAYQQNPSARSGATYTGWSAGRDGMSTSAGSNKAILYARRSTNEVKWWSNAEGKFNGWDDPAELANLISVSPDTGVHRTSGSFGNPNAALHYYAWQWTDFGSVPVWEVEAFARGIQA